VRKDSIVSDGTATSRRREFRNRQCSMMPVMQFSQQRCPARSPRVFQPEARQVQQGPKPKSKKNPAVAGFVIFQCALF
jgi:hypothetical protein